jgi:hypothetical protein
MNGRSGKADARLLIGVLVGVAVLVAVIAVVRHDVTGYKGNGLGKQYDYDVGDLTHVDPNLILYEQSGDVIDTGFAASHAVAADSKGSIYVAGDQAIHIFSDHGVPLGKIDLDGAPRCLTVLPDGTIYVGLKDHVEVFDAQRQRQASWGRLGPNALLTSIAVSGDNVFLADAGDRVVVRCDRAGKAIGNIGRKDPMKNAPGFVIPSPYFDLAVTGDGLLRVVNPGQRRIEAYTFDGDYEFCWGTPSPQIDGFCGCCNPVNIAILPDGSFVTCEKGLVRVKIYSSEGEFKGVVAGPSQLVPGRECKICELPAQCQAGGFDVATDPAGRVIVLDTIKNIVRIFSKKKGRS